MFIESVGSVTFVEGPVETVETFVKVAFTVDKDELGPFEDVSDEDVVADVAVTVVLCDGDCDEEVATI